MVRIIYGVCGEGMGHAIRSKPVIEYLMKKGHKVKILSGDRPYKFLKKHFKDVEEIFPFLMRYRKNAISNSGTVWINLKRVSELNKKMLKMRRIFKNFKPDLVITDFEPLTLKLAKLKRIPTIAIDNPNINARTSIYMPKKFMNLKMFSVSFIKSYMFGADYYIITTFFYPKKKKRRTILVPPIVRDEIIKLKPKKGEHILVYQTSKSNEELIPALKKINRKFIVYGFDISKKEDNVTLRKFNTGIFYEDFANCRAIITNGGFTLISEAIYLKKPILSIPVKKQYEQIVNAVHVQRLKYGEFSEETTKEAVEHFLKNLSKYEKVLSKYKQDGNKKLYKELDKVMAKLLRK